MAKTKAKNETYEALYEQLLEYLDKLENGNLKLDESLKLYQEAMELADQCQKQLESAQEKLKQIESAGEI